MRRFRGRRGAFLSTTADRLTRSRAQRDRAHREDVRLRSCDEELVRTIVPATIPELREYDYLLHRRLSVLCTDRLQQPDDDIGGSSDRSLGARGRISLSSDPGRPSALKQRPLSCAGEPRAFSSRPCWPPSTQHSRSCWSCRGHRNAFFYRSTRR